MNILVIDTKLMMYKQHHSHKAPLDFLGEVASLSLKLLPHIHKVVFVKDLGKSKRCEIFPNYKGKRTETKDKQTSQEKQRLSKFLNLYNNSDNFLSNFGSVIAINGIEADDLASMIAKRLSGEHHIYLLSGDSDWSRFLTNSNITMLHPQRALLIDKDNAEAEFGVLPQYKLLIDSVTGVDKESVDGITKLGMKRAVGFLKLAEYSQDKFFTLLDSALEVKKYGMVLPKWADSAKEVWERNYKIFEAHTFEELRPEEVDIFFAGWSNKPPKSIEDILKVSLLDLEVPYLPPLNVIEFFRLQD